MQTVLQREVEIRPPKPAAELAKTRQRQLRVAAYCRVSTDQEEQQSSYEAQREYYTDKIMKNPNWKMAGLFADEGITGTCAQKRKDFMRMIQQCKRGKIDMILTKSISRFARNTVDCLQYVRMLREMGVTVIFEKEGIDTSKMVNEMAITLTGCFAQAESESISQNVTWGKRKAFKKGHVTYNFSRLYGYERGDDGQPRIVAGEAEIVKRIFKMFLDGSSIATITKTLNSEGIPTKIGGRWAQSVVSNILKSEKYIGDALLQKTYVADVLTHRAKKNNGELPQYYVKNCHEPIIDRDTFRRVQEEFARRAGKPKTSEKAQTELGRYSSRYALSELLVCGCCGSPYKRVTWARNGQKKIVWRCVSRLDFGTKYCKDSPTIAETTLHSAILETINRVAGDRELLMETIRQNLRTALNGRDDGIDVCAVKKRIQELEALTVTLLNDTKGSVTAAEYLESKFEEVWKETQEQKELLRQHEERLAAAGGVEQRLAEIDRLLNAEALDLTVYDDRLVRRLVDTVKVLSAEKILVIFKGGAEIEQTL